MAAAVPRCLIFHDRTSTSWFEYPTDAVHRLYEPVTYVDFPKRHVRRSKGACLSHAYEELP